MLKNLIQKYSYRFYQNSKTYYFYNKFKSSNLIISYSTSPFIELLDRTNVVYMFKCPLGDCVSKDNNICVDLTTTTFSRRLTMHLNDSSCIALRLKTHSILISKFQKILVETPHPHNSTRN